MSKYTELERKVILKKYAAAYELVYDKKPRVEMKNSGWVAIDSVNYRISDIPVMTKMLARRVRK